METRNYVMPIAALIAVAVFGYGVYLVGSGFMGGGHGGEPEKNASAILLAALAKPGAYQAYAYGYTDYLDGYRITTTYASSPSFSAVRVASPVFEKAAYRNASASVFCITFGANTSCSEVAQNSTLNPTYQSMVSSMPGSRAAANVEALEVYVRSGAANFSQTVDEIEYGGRKCNVVRYTLDYNRLTYGDINELGMRQTDPVLLYTKNLSFEYCIDNESDMVYARLDYVFMGAAKHTETNYTQARWNYSDPAQFSFPAPGNESATLALFLDAIGAEKSVLVCYRNTSTRDECIRRYAVQNGFPDVCLLAGLLQDKCILTLAPGALRDDLCAKVGNHSLRDDCWTEMAARKLDASFCSAVADAEKRAYCLELANKSAECGTGADCFIAGCSGQLCVPEALKDTVTTCEYLPEYDCLNLTSCGCSGGKCGWEENQDYAECVAEKSNSTVKGG